MIHFFHVDIYGRWSYEISQTKTWLGHPRAKQYCSQKMKNRSEGHILIENFGWNSQILSDMNVIF